MSNKYSKYLNHGRKRSDEKRTLAEVYKRCPIIKCDELTHFKDPLRCVTFQVPVQSRHYTYGNSHVSNKASTIFYQSCESIEEARYYIDNYSEIRRKVILTNKINRLRDKIKKLYKRLDTSNFRGLYSLVNFGFKNMVDYPREDQYCSHLNSKGKETHKTIYKHGRSFAHTPEQQKIFIKALNTPSVLSAEDIQFVIDNLKDFNVDVSKNLDIVREDQFTDFYKTYKTSEFQKKLRAFLKQIHELSLQKDVLIKEHGQETRENIQIPKGYKLMDAGYYCWEGYECDEEMIAVQSEDKTIEILIFLGCGMGGYSGEVQYKVDKDTSSFYSIGRRGIDSAFYTDSNRPITITQIIEEQGKRARERQEKIRRSVNVTLGGRSWKVTPESIEEIKKLLKAGKSRSFLPSGMGIGVIIANSKDNLPYNLSKYYAGESAEKLFGMPVYAQDFEYD